jgi:dTDP-4-dehydrorhamnose reductase
MNIVLFGKNGQLGSEFQKILPKLGSLTCLDYEEIDLCNIPALQQALNELKPDMIVNASAYTAVDRAETEQETAMKINALAPGIMAEWARKSGAVLIHYSTDYVFDGRKGLPYVESDLPNPLNVYGKSKLAGEENIQQTGDAYLIFRTSWVYSVGGTGFVNKVLEWARKNQTLKIVNDQISNPTWARDLAEATFRVVSTHRDGLQDVMKERRGVYHLAGGGYTSRYEWAKQILANDPNRTEQLVQSIEPVSSGEFPTPAARPLFSALDCSKFETTFNIKMPGWKDSLQEAMTG